MTKVTALTVVNGDIALLESGSSITSEHTVWSISSWY